MLTLTTVAWFFAIPIAGSLGYVFGACIAVGKRADEIAAKPKRRRVTKILNGRRISPDLVLISPTEFRVVKS